jgi:hypothetical protein
MEQDQYAEVNAITPAMTRVQGALPPQVRPSYIKALISQAKSGAWQGAPAVQSALSNLPTELTAAAFEGTGWKDAVLGVAKSSGQAIPRGAPGFLARRAQNALR